MDVETTKEAQAIVEQDLVAEANSSETGPPAQKKKPYSSPTDSWVPELGVDAHVARVC
jgi:hypothetical protein